MNVVIVGPAPCRLDVKNGRLFQHPVYDGFKEILRELGLDMSCVQYANAVNEPVAKPSAAQIAGARNTLQAAVNHVEKAAVLLLGSAPVQSVFGRSCLSSIRGRAIEASATKGFEGSFFFATWHPSILNVQPNLKHQFTNDLRTFVKHTLGQPVRSSHVTYTYTGETCAIAKPGNLVAYDLETSGLVENSYSLPNVWMIGFSTREPDGSFTNLVGDSWPSTASTVAELVGHNSRQFDDQITGWQSHDTQIMAYLLDNTRTKTGGYGLQALAVEYLGVEPWKDTVDWNWADWNTLDDERKERSRLYNARDTQYTLELAEIMIPKLKEAGLWTLYEKLYLPAATAFGEMHRTGVYVDPERLAAARQQLEAERDRALALIRSMPDIAPKFNPSSAQQVAQFVQEKWGLTAFELTATGKPKIDDVCLEKWIEYAETRDLPRGSVEPTGTSVCSGEPDELRDGFPVARIAAETRTAEAADDERRGENAGVGRSTDAVGFIRAIQQFRHARKHLSTYVGAFERARDSTGRVHPSYRLTATDTGRTATSDFPLQQMPRDSTLRGCIAAPPGWLFGATDYSNIEQRVIAWLAQEPRLLAQFEAFDAGETPYDNHTLLAAKLLSKPAGQVTSTERSLGKNIGFATQYLGTSRTIQDWLYKNFGLRVSDRQGEIYRGSWFESYPGLVRWYEQIWDQLSTQDFQATSTLGFTRKFGIPAGGHQQALEVYRQATNFQVQSFANHLGFAAVIAASAAIKSSPELSQTVRLVGYVHDSILWEATEESVEAARACVEHAMIVGAWNLLEENFPDLSKDRPLLLPLRVDTKIGKNWT